MSDKAELVVRWPLTFSAVRYSSGDGGANAPARFEIAAAKFGSLK